MCLCHFPGDRGYELGAQQAYVSGDEKYLATRPFSVRIGPADLVR